MNILYVAPDIPVPHTGTFIGGSTHTLKIAQELAKKGNHVHILSRRMEGQKKYEILGGNIFVHRVYRGLLFPVQQGVSKKNGKDSNAAVDSIFNFMKNIYFSGIYRLMLMIIVSRIMTREKIDITLERNSAKGIGVFTGILFGVPAITEVIDPDFSKTALRFSRRVFAYTYRILGDDFPREKVELTNAGVDTDDFRTDIDGKDIRSKYDLVDKKVVIYAGEMSAWHGAEDLSAVAERLDDDSRILVVGKNVELLRGKSKKFVFTGFVEHGRIPEYIAAADVAVAPYNPYGFRDMEQYGFYFSPIKIFEYMACGKPVVTTDVEIVRDVINESGCGLLVKPGNAEQLSGAIRYLFKNREKANEMGRRGREAVMGRYTWKKVAEQIENGMKGVLKNGNV